MTTTATTPEVQQIITYLEKEIELGDSMISFLRKQGKKDRVESWTSSTIALEDTLNYIKENIVK